MRLNPFNPDNISVGRGGGGGFPGGGAGGLGCGTIVIALIAYFVFGVDPMQTIGTLESAQQQAGPQQIEDGGASVQELCTANAYATESCNALSSLNDTWEAQFSGGFQGPKLWFYTGGTNSGCGAASSAVGPFYCPADQGIYIDTSFYDQMAQQLGAGGDFARYYVMAHEYGHHIQALTGVADQIRSGQSQNPGRANQLQMRMELQADCYAGVWAGQNRNAIEPGDFEEGMTAASAIGDDTLSRRAGREASPESFTHGSSAQRMEALRLGMESGDASRCERIVELG